LAGLVTEHPVVADVRGRGAMIAIEFAETGSVGPNGPRPDPAAAQAVAKACHEAGLLVLTCGTYGNVLRFLPPLVMPHETLNRGLDILAAALAAGRSPAAG
jgi:4-aminobutyrate aminotransferase/(S)-3-amino-2-methylpropionate transaminase